MIRLPIALVAAALLVAGCGGDDEEPTAQTGESTTAQTEAETSPTGEETTETREERERSEDRREEEDGGGGRRETGPRANAEQLERAVESCKDNVRQAPQLSDDAKDDLVKLCEQAASGDPEELRRISREVCKRIITDTLPEGEQREQALELCEQSGSRN